MVAFAAPPALAACSTTGLATTCDATSPNTTGIGIGPTEPANRVVTIGAGAQLVVGGDQSAISLSDGASITIGAGAMVSAAGVTAPGNYPPSAANTIEFRNGGTLTIAQGATVQATGSISMAEPINLQGTGSTIINNGSILGSTNAPAAAIWFEVGGTNTIINNATGVITAPGAPSVVGSYAGRVDIPGPPATFDFTNRGTINGNLIFAGSTDPVFPIPGGNDTLQLYPGQVITGIVDGSLGTDTLRLSADPGTSGTTATDFPQFADPTRFMGFEALVKDGAGTWTLSSAIPSGLTSVTVDAGTLILTGDNSAYAGTTAVQLGGTLQGPALALPRAITDNGLVRIAQDIDAGYAGLISGTGAVEKTGAATLTLTGANTYSGGTIITQGVLAIGSDAVIGATTGGVTFNGGTLRFLQPFDLAPTRPIAINAPGGTIDTNGFTTTIAQGITGPGGLAVTGAGSLILTGANTYAGGTSIAAATTVSIGAGGTGGSLQGNVLNNGTLVFNRAGTLTFGGVISGTGAVRQDGPGVTVLAGANTYAGPTAVNAGVLQAGIAGAFSAASSHSVAAGAELDLAGFDQTVASLTNAGLVSLRGAPGTTLTVTGPYVGQGGVIGLNTVLGGDNSVSDRLVIRGGTATGDSILRITNIGGQGAQTVQGIRVVETQNGGTTAAGAFRLDTRVAAGAFEYQLFRGGSSSADDWYLRSFLLPSEGGGGGDPTSPPIPLYRPEAALYAPIPAIARQMGLATLGTLHERVGDEENIRDLTSTSPYANGAWARAFGERSRNRWSGTVDPRATGDLVGLQAGFDIIRTNPYAGGHRDHAGVYVAYTNYNAPVTSGFALGVQNLRVGRLLMEGPSVGAYWTHFGPSGWYVDAVFQTSWYDITARSDYGTGLSTNATGYTASLEAGYPIHFGAGNRWQVEPQAQIIYQSVSVDRSRDAFSSVDWDEGGAWTGRIGARLQYTGRDTQGTLWQPYAKLNLWHAFSGTDRASFGSGAPIENRFGDTALEAGAGITARVNANTSFYAHADYRWSVDGGRSRQSATQGSVGIRINW
ncbi:MAG TPA: autotransporter outer membrane beta-barrel domain-containing protein [Roseomonas sp.]